MQYLQLYSGIFGHSQIGSHCGTSDTSFVVGENDIYTQWKLIWKFGEIDECQDNGNIRMEPEKQFSRNIGTVRAKSSVEILLDV